MSLKRNVVANYLGQGWRALMAVAFVPIYIRYLGIEAYGLIGIFALLQSWMSLLDMGMKPTLAREMARFTGGARDVESTRDLLRSIETIGTGIAVVVALSVWAMADWLATNWLTTKDLSPDLIARAFVIIGIIISLRFIENIYVSSIVGLQRQVLENVVASTMATVRGLGAVAVLVWVSPTIDAFFVWQGAISVVTTALYAGVVYRSLPSSSRSARFSRAALTAVWRFAAGMIAITFLALLLVQIDKIILSKLLTLQAFSYYVFAGTVAGTLHRLTSPITTAFYPRFTQFAARNDEEALRAAYHQGSQLVSVCVGAAAIVLITLGERILLLWTGDPALTRETSRLLPILALGTLLNSIMWIPYQIQLAHGWTSLAVTVNVIAVVILVPAIFLIAPEYGAAGAAWVWVALNAGYLVVNVYFMHKRLLRGEKWRWYAYDVGLPILGALIAGVFFRWAIPGDLGKGVELFLLVISCCSIVLVAAFSAATVRRQLCKYLPAAIRF